MEEGHLKANASWPREDREKDTAERGNRKVGEQQARAELQGDLCGHSWGFRMEGGEEATGRHGLALHELSKHSLPHPTTTILLSSHTSHGWHF